MGTTTRSGGFVVVTRVQNHVGQTTVNNDVFRDIVKALRIPSRSRDFETAIEKEIDAINTITIFRGE